MNTINENQNITISGFNQRTAKALEAQDYGVNQDGETFSVTISHTSGISDYFAQIAMTIKLNQ